MLRGAEIERSCRTGEFAIGDAKRVLQQYRAHSGLKSDITGLPKSADGVAKVEKRCRKSRKN
jgi:hypothetical protein